MRTIARLTAAVAILALLAVPASAKPFPRLWVFGDSTVDTGWYKRAPYSGIQKFDVYLADPALGVGKPTNNPRPMSVEVLAAVLGVDADPANLRAGTNFATSGARNDSVNKPGSGFFLNAVPTLQQLENLMTRHPLKLVPKYDLYLISSGHNDVTHAVNNLQTRTDDPLGYVTSAATQLANKIAELQQHGANFIIVANLFESFGPNELTKQYRAAYNATLKSTLDALGVQYAWGDINGVRNKIVQDQWAFGLNYITTADADLGCSLPADPAITSAWALLCSPMSTVSNPYLPKANEALFADKEHFATGGQRVIGGYYFCLARKTWPERFAGPGGGLPGRPRPPFACSLFFPPRAP